MTDRTASNEGLTSLIADLERRAETGGVWLLLQKPVWPETLAESLDLLEGLESDEKTLWTPYIQRFLALYCTRRWPDGVETTLYPAAEADAVLTAGAGFEVVTISAPAR